MRYAFLCSQLWPSLLAALAVGLPAAAQVPVATSPLSISQQFSRYSQRTLTEKLFGHLDQPVYNAGETLWLKLYAVDGTYHKPLTLSKVAYVEVLDHAQHPVVQAKIELQNAVGQAALALPADLATGRYTVRAYTSWMKNAGPEFYFQTAVTVLNTFGTAGAAPDKAAPTYDVQFFPEGGNLVQGLPSRVALRVVDKAGHGRAATGTIRDARGAVAASFQTLKFGLGSFVLTPTAAGGPYTATIQLTGGPTVTSKLPVAYERGYVLCLSEASPTQLRLRVQAHGTDSQDNTLFLLGHSGQRLAVAQTAELTNGEATFLVNKQELLDGISRFTVFNSARKPLCERLYFQRPTHNIAVTASLPKASYSFRERVDLRLATADAHHSATPANLSVAVYRLDSLSGPAALPDINSYLYLTSDLAGSIENPIYYCQDSSKIAREAADNLMLTHGWRRFRWEDVLANQVPSPEYLPEVNGHLVRGRVSVRATSQGVAGVPAYLSAPGRAFRFHNAVSQDNGLVQFELRNFYGSHTLITQPNLRRDSLYQVKLLSPFSARYAPTLSPDIRLPERLEADIAHRHLQAQVQQAYASRYQRPYQLPTGDTTLFYGVASEQYLLDDYTRFKVLEEVMREYVPGVQVRKRGDGFHFMVMDRPRQSIFQDNPLVLLDGVPVFNINQMLAFDPLKIRRLDVVTSRYILESQTYEGVVSYTTYKGDLGGFPLDAKALQEEYEGLQGQREFFAPRYETAQQQQTRLPDLRNLLYWNPAVRLTATQPQTLSFFTSDQPGRYVVVVQGLGADGRTCSTNTTLLVKPAL